MRIRKTVSDALWIVLSIVFSMISNKPALAEEPIELKISHFGSPQYIQQTAVLEPWAKKIEELTNGKVKFILYPKETLGKAGEQYDLAVKGVADISFGLPDYTPGRFPLTSVMKLPFMGVLSGGQASLVLWHIYQKYLADEFKDVKVLWLFCHGAGQLHTKDKQVRTLQDLKGLRLRAADPFIGQVLERLGAIAVTCPASEVVNLFKENKIDGVVIPWEGALSFKLLDYCKYHTEIDMYTMPFFVVMNKARYESLPVDIKKVIDDNSGEAMALLAGSAFDKEDTAGRKIAEDRGDTIYRLPLTEMAQWKKLAMPAGDAWVQGMKVKGLPGDKVLADVVDLFIQLKK